MNSKISPTLRNKRLIESDAFPFEFLSELAERESWRKEIYRPIYHIHKWWAKRLGSVFRGILLGCALPESADLANTFYRKHDLSHIIVFDPFMGSGTTIGEAHKLGCTALGRDINPVACENVRVALGPMDRVRLQNAFMHLSATVGERIRDLYQTVDEAGKVCDVLYWFWVKQVPCPHCTATVDLFPSRIVARNAYPDQKPEIQVCCPQCGDIFPATNGHKRVQCRSCSCDFDPEKGSAKGAHATCTTCSNKFSIIEAVRRTGSPPLHRLYAKLLLTSDGKKRYLPVTSKDILAYEHCSEKLRMEEQHGAVCLPTTTLSDGYNTRQAINYNYRTWREFFNDRQLLALGWLHAAIAALPEASTRDALLNLFSGVLEFNNQFTSYKGEGTGAVRHMFSHHILKPERMPIEANVWGTPKSSGSFSTLFKSRLLRALDYRIAPFEVSLGESGKTHQCSDPFSEVVENYWPQHQDLEKRGIYISCGSSDTTGLPDRSIDYVVTDPPFFDNVHYSELADFFHAWQSLHPHGFLNDATTTRNQREVQDTDADAFACKLRAIFTECHRVLKDEGLLVFSYHHSRAEGWTSLAEAIYGAGFTVANAHPVKAEMSVAMPKTQAKEPIQLDTILVCQKQEHDRRSEVSLADATNRAIHVTETKAVRLSRLGLLLSKNDYRIMLYSQFLAELGRANDVHKVVTAVACEALTLDAAAETMNTAPIDLENTKQKRIYGVSHQMDLLHS